MIMALRQDNRKTAYAVMTAFNVIEGADGVVFSTMDLLDCLTIIRWESGGEADAVNLVDSNAIAGHPSRGLMQVIPATFLSYALPGYDCDINDPVSNVIAGVRYALKRYGSLDRVPGIMKLAEATQKVYVGY